MTQVNLRQPFNRQHRAPRHRPRRGVPGPGPRHHRPVHHRRAAVDVPGHPAARPVARRDRVRTRPVVR